jgi:hypothetical protein
MFAVGGTMEAKSCEGFMVSPHEVVDGRLPDEVQGLAGFAIQPTHMR